VLVSKTSSFDTKHKFLFVGYVGQFHVFELLNGIETIGNHYVRLGEAGGTRHPHSGPSLWKELYLQGIHSKRV